MAESIHKVIGIFDGHKRSHHGSVATTCSSSSALSRGSDGSRRSSVGCCGEVNPAPQTRASVPSLRPTLSEASTSGVATMNSSADLLPVPPPEENSRSTTPQGARESSDGRALTPSQLNQQPACAASCSQILCTPLRVMVSQNRRRYQQDGFDLDLTYITDRIIAMGYPADTTEALYRNSMTHIVKFLEYYHPGHYKVFNLRGQYVYDTSKFHNRVLSFEMTDHHPPRLELMAPFCREVHEYLQADPRNVVAVHCKAGKGRTGVMICAYLVYINFYSSPRQNMDYYSIVRTRNNKGVTIPSQRRYVYYFAHLRRKRLNYVPLRTELVGIYVEQPPRISSTLTRGALRLRVANGDVEVFIGDPLWISAEQSDEETDMWHRYPIGRGEDHHDPHSPKFGNDCISRRCYGWTVPTDKRVFLEGDVRIDLYQKSQIKVISLAQDRRKIGHIWLNTMFTCPGFCGAPYVHGDEAHPYPPGGTTIVKHTRTTGTASVPSSPPSGKSNGSSSVRISQRTPSFDHRKSKTNSRLNGVVRKLTDIVDSTRSPNGCADASSKCISEEDATPTEDARRSINHTLNIERPPGLELHCPESTLPLIYNADKPAPRYGIEEMLREAHRKNLITDSYNARRLSQPQEGSLMPCAQIGRPHAGGPVGLQRLPQEHVQTFSVLEIDRAFKSKDINDGFKVHVITRCVDPGSPSDQHLAANFMKITYEKQRKKDAENRQKVCQRMRRLGILVDERSAVCGGDSPSPGSSSEDVAGTMHADASSFPIDDVRMADPHLRKFLFRQRANSRSRYPRVDYQCPLLAQRRGDYSCESVADRQLSSITDRPIFDVDEDLVGDCNAWCQAPRPHLVASFDDFEDDEADEEGEGDEGDDVRTTVPSLEQSTHTIAADRPPTAASVAAMNTGRHNSSSSGALISGYTHGATQKKKKSLSVSTASDEGGIACSEQIRHHPSDCSWQDSSSDSTSSSQVTLLKKASNISMSQSGGEPGVSTDENDVPIAISSSAPSR